MSLIDAAITTLGSHLHPLVQQTAAQIAAELALEKAQAGVGGATQADILEAQQQLADVMGTNNQFDAATGPVIPDDYDQTTCWEGEDSEYCGEDPEFVDQDWFWMFKEVRYIVWFSVAAVPWALFGLLLVLFNILVNIFFNDVWCYGNIWLIANTAYLVLQYTLSVILMLEVDWWLKWMKFIRIGSLFVSVVYTAFYLLGWAVLITILDDLDGHNITYSSVYTVMVLSYNLMFHSPQLIVNFVIILKEATMEGVQFLNDVAGTGMDDYSLLIHNFLDFFVAIGNWFNVWWWIEAVDDPELFEDQYE